MMATGSVVVPAAFTLLSIATITGGAGTLAVIVIVIGLSVDRITSADVIFAFGKAMNKPKVRVESTPVVRLRDQTELVGVKEKVPSALTNVEPVISRVVVS